MLVMVASYERKGKAMYRTYEDPYEIERKIERVEIEMQEAIAMGDENMLIDLAEELAELNDRLNFAWQDDEYDSEY